MDLKRSAEAVLPSAPPLPPKPKQRPTPSDGTDVRPSKRMRAAYRGDDGADDHGFKFDAFDNDDDVEDFACPACEGCGRLFKADIPVWADRITSAESVYAVLKANKIDDRAMQQAMLVVQEFGADGVTAIRGIVVNMLKQWGFLDNASAFVASSCMKYRRSMS